MQVSYRWLKEYVDLKGVTPEQLAEELTRGGIEVDGIQPRNNGVEKVVVGKVLDTQPHPNADKLKVCTVDVNEEDPLQIVCGAANVAKGQYVPVALHKARLPGGVKIKKSKLRGVASQGMICSADELGLPEKLLTKHQQDGILVLPEETKIGSDVAEVLELDDYILELDLTPNRSDCLSMRGVAYEAAALLDRELNLPQTEEKVGKGKEVDITLDVEEDCPFYALQVVKNLKLGPSPQWMQNRLMAAGVRPINNVVDVTNYVMLEYGQPLHAFDYQKVSDEEIIVRRARAGETVETLDGVTRGCDEETLLITDGEKPIAIAGVMGGANSEVTEETTTVLLESAYFSPTLVRRTARRLGLRSEASNRFEKGVDPEGIIPALERAVHLLTELAGGQAASPVTVEKVGDVEEVTIQLRHNRLTGLLGVQITEEAVRDIFKRLRFETEVKNETYRVQVPSRRPDLSIEVDLIEEVARLYGYNRIPSTLPWGQQFPGSLTQEQKLRRRIRHTLQDVGLFEVIGYSLTHPKRLKEIASLYSGFQPIRISMPMSDERKVLRTSLIPQLVETAEYNVHRRQEEIRLFELSRVFLTEEKLKDDLPEERWMLAGLLTGSGAGKHWGKQEETLDFYTVKGLLEMLFTRLGVKGVNYRAAQLKGYHPGRTAELVIGEETVGILGQLHPKVEANHDLDDTYVFELDLVKVLEKAGEHIVGYHPLPVYPSSSRDLALVVDESLPAGELEAVIRSAGGDLLEKVNLFDVFTGNQVGEGKKSVAYSLTYRSDDRTLTDEEVNQAHQRVVEQLESLTGATLRK
ncbi:phenylalanine--tRNA ligase subunit beta [Kroppenstedtia pulmonis]|uniref:Phenylalanine--tRNA ligase beta subunit n=1 Tax=Kroppenstedtia pulmonis TaxID=1380685 RepID=A0A7D4BIY9_9BACL|nr:phenylalanine--tRNA ligase subunit beta [Kroppenstedtia pulmonis]QKG84010.1 phenylalanine--tRNA ligase subunit beta [Kroppenstedtia pulmonis]